MIKPYLALLHTQVKSRTRREEVKSNGKDGGRVGDLSSYLGRSCRCKRRCKRRRSFLLAAGLAFLTLLAWRGGEWSWFRAISRESLRLVQMYLCCNFSMQRYFYDEAGAVLVPRAGPLPVGTNPVRPTGPPAQLSGCLSVGCQPGTLPAHSLAGSLTRRLCCPPFALSCAMCWPSGGSCTTYCL